MLPMATQHWNSYEMKIIEAAFRVVEQYTISGTRMSLIACEAKMSTTNLHYHFKTKKDLMLALLRYTQESFDEMRDADLSGRPQNLEGQLAGFFAQKKDVLLHHRDMDRVQLDFWSSCQVNPEIMPYFEKSFQLWRQHIVDVILLYDPGQPVEKLESVAEIMVSMMMGAALQGFGPDNQAQMDRYFTMCLCMINTYLNLD